jgi:hypothetical protein
VRIWHDNSGKGEWASWFLKYIVVQDVQTRQKFYFICQKWFAVEKDDGLIDRVIPVCGEAQKKEIGYLLAEESKNKITDGHLWFSVFFRPARSHFTRVQRITCCFVLLFISMLMNILFYGQGDSTNDTGGIRVGPFYLTTQQASFFFKVFLFIKAFNCLFWLGWNRNNLQFGHFSTQFTHRRIISKIKAETETFGNCQKSTRELCCPSGRDKSRIYFVRTSLRQFFPP